MAKINIRVTTPAGATAHISEYTVPQGSYVIEASGGAVGVWRRVFRSWTRFLAAVEAERAAAGEDAFELSFWKAIGSGPDGRTEAVRV